MPKIKTHRGAAKRLRKTGTGLVTRKHAYHRHKALCKSAKQKRQLRFSTVVDKTDQRTMSRLIPYL
ncbi:MAG: 50S ribosomal protein L35 [Negativicutes bacterium]|nr:50S ribosomal protein L35 [Negativicutes bacterium]